MKFQNIIYGLIFSYVLALLVGCASSPLHQADSLAKSNPEAAIEAYKTIINLASGTPDAQKAYLKMAETYYTKMSNQEKGISIYEEAVKAYPKTNTSVEANYKLGMHYLLTKDYEKALSKFANAIQENPAPDKKSRRISEVYLMIDTTYKEMEPFLKVKFSDPGLELAIRNSIGKPDGEITRRELKNITQLDASGKNIFNLDGLEYCTELQNLHLRNNNIKDISQLKSLTKIGDGKSEESSKTIYQFFPNYRIVDLDLRNNKISDISSLIDNSGIGIGDGIDLTDNPIGSTQVSILREKGAYVWY